MDDSDLMDFDCPPPSMPVTSPILTTTTASKKHKSPKILSTMAPSLKRIRSPTSTTLNEPRTPLAVQNTSSPPSLPSTLSPPDVPCCTTASPQTSVLTPTIDISKMSTLAAPTLPASQATGPNVPDPTQLSLTAGASEHNMPVPATAANVTTHITQPNDIQIPNTQGVVGAAAPGQLTVPGETIDL